MSKKLFIKTYGCQMNMYDSARMADVLAPLGYVQVESPELADMVILNTCHIREKAAEKVYSELGRINVLKRAREQSGGSMTIAVAGCVAQAEGAEILRRAPFVGMVFGPQTYHRLPEMVVRASRGQGVLETDFPVISKFDELPHADAATAGDAEIGAFLTVQEGCDKFCTYCVVPYTRGAEYSRPVAQVLDEARRMVARGTRELTLLGQNVNAYHGAHSDGSVWGLGRLMRALAELDGLVRIRYTTSHPRDMDDELVAAHREVPQVMPYLHLPVQSGSDAVLAAMNRQHKVDDYFRLIERLRAARSDLALSSDFIVGFPGETDADFAATLALIRRVGYVQAYSFKFSPRPGTPAALLENQIPEPVMVARLAELQELLWSQQLAFNKATIGRTIPVLFERRGRYDGQMGGRSPYLQAVHAEAPADLLGRVVDVVVTSATLNAVSGHLAAQPTSVIAREAAA